MSKANTSRAAGRGGPEAGTGAGPDPGHGSGFGPRGDTPGAEEKRRVPGTFSALAGVIDSGLSMLRNEAGLLRAEAEHALGETQRALIALVAAAVLGMVGLNVLAGAAVAGVTALGLSPFWAALAVGGGFLLLALCFALAAKARLRSENLAPRRAADSLRRNLDTVQSALRQDRDEQI